MYSNAAAGVQTYNPAASSDTSTQQIHSLPAGSQQYYSLPAQQMSIPPGAPATTQMGGYGGGQPAATMGQHYSVPAQGYQPQTVPGAPGYQAATMQQPPAQMYMQTSSAQQPQPGTAAEYQPYNMHCQFHYVSI